MKRHNVLISALLAVISLASCGTSTDRVFMLDEANRSSITLTSYAELEVLVTGDSTFLIVIGNESCSCTTVFMPFVEDFVEAFGVPFYYLEYTKLLNQEEKFGLPVVVPNIPVLGIFDAGELHAYRAYNVNNSSQNSMFESYEGLTTYLADYVTISPSMNFINKTELDALFLGSDNFILYFGRHSCPDCTYAFDSFFRPYLEAHPDAPTIYGFEVEKEGVWNNVDRNNTPGWVDFKNDYGLSNVVNEAFGYWTGYVPTWMYIEANGTSIAEDPSIIKDMIVVYNDTNLQLNEDGSTYIDDNGTPENTDDDHTVPTDKLTRSFFDGTRPLQYTDVNLMAGEGTAFTPTTVRAEYHAQLQPIYDPLLTAFFEMYLPLVTVA